MNNNMFSNVECPTFVPTNGVIYGNTRSQGTHVRLVCNDGYLAVNGTDTYCKNGQWLNACGMYPAI